MKRMHIHVSVDDLPKSVAFYSAMFDTEPTVQKDDYAKWMLDDPCVNFAITPARTQSGLDHLGIQVESDQELAQMHDRLDKAQANIVEQTGAACCYVRSDKYWSEDPQGIAWETFHSLTSIPTFGADTGKKKAKPAEQVNACCGPQG